MDKDFWLERWQVGQTGWHEDEGNAMLKRHWPGMQLLSGARVLVPLCGKSVDMAWLTSRGYAVTGADLSARAAEAFFEEQDGTPEIDDHDGFGRYADGETEILVGDFLSAPTTLLAAMDGFFDRAALIALKPKQRERYAQLLGSGLQPGASGLLITIEYPHGDMDGPPFSVDADEVQRLFAAHFEIECLERYDALDENEHLRGRGVTRLQECAYRLLRRRC